MRRWRSNRASVPSTDVDEVAQEVYLRLTRYSDDELAESPQDHLFRIAASVTDEWRARAGSSCPDDGPPLGNEGDSGLAEGPLVKEQVCAAVDNLPSQQREALVLHVNEDLTYRQIAARMRLAPRIARRNLVSAYTHLRYELRPSHWM